MASTFFLWFSFAFALLEWAAVFGGQVGLKDRKERFAGFLFMCCFSSFCLDASGRKSWCDAMNGIDLGYQEQRLCKSLVYMCF
jgi:hypothetical protein